MRSRGRFSIRVLPYPDSASGQTACSTEEGAGSGYRDGNLRRRCKKAVETAERRQRHIEELQEKLTERRGDIEFLNAKAGMLSLQLSETQQQLMEANEELSRTRESMRQLLASVSGGFPVRPFPEVTLDKEQALKPLEEAAEAFGAWQIEDSMIGSEVSQDARARIVEECADVIQAAVNLAAAAGCDDMTHPMVECWRRNHDRGRC